MYALFKPDLLKLAHTVHHQHELFENGRIPADELSNIQLERLKSTLHHVRKNAPFYRNALSTLSDSNISNLDWDAFRKLPFTTKNDLRTAGHDMTAAPLTEAWIYYETTGTTGSATPCPRNEQDSIFNNTPLILRYGEIFRAHGHQHIVGVMAPTELHSTGDTFEDVCRSLGHTVVKMWPRSPVVGLDRAVTLIKELKITALVCTPAIAISLAKHLLRRDCTPSDLGVKLIFTLGELTTPALLRNIGEVWGSAVYNCMYASQESSILALSDVQGNLCTIPLNVVYEVIDPLTEQVLLPEDARMTGELVITHLYPGQKPLIRYRTGDMVRARVMDTGQWRIIPIGRIRATLTINGSNHCAYDIEAALFENLKGCLDYHILVETVAGIDQLSVTLELESSSAAQNDLLSIASSMADKLDARVRIAVGSTDAVTGTAAMVIWKAARLHDKRQGSDNQERETALKIAARRASFGSASSAPRKPHPWVYLDGEVVAAAEALVPTTTQALNYGTAVFEGIRAYASSNGELNVFRLDDHLKRLEHSARLLQLEGLPQRPEMKTIILDLLQRNQASTDSHTQPLAYKRALLPGFGFGVKLTGGSTGLAHAFIALSKGVDARVVDAAAHDPDGLDARLRALHNFTLEVIHCCGRLEKQAIDAVLRAGFNTQNMLDVILGVSQKNMSTILNSIAGTKVDHRFKWDAFRGIEQTSET